MWPFDSLLDDWFGEVDEARRSGRTFERDDDEDMDENLDPLPGVNDA